MDGGIFKPYRAPCGLAFGNNCYSHAGAADYGINVYTNTTTVPTAESPIAPYERYAPDTGGTCTSFNCDGSLTTCESWIGTNTNPGFIQYTLVAGQPNTVPQSWSHTTGDTVDFAVCQKTGFKNVAAARQWHGCYGFTDPDGSGCQDTFLTCDADIFVELGGGNTCTRSEGDVISYLGYQPSPSQTRYCECEWDLSFSYSHGSVLYTNPGPDYSLPGPDWVAGSEITLETVSASGSHTVTVDPLSGIITNTCDINQTYQAYAPAPYTIYNPDGSAYASFDAGLWTSQTFSGCGGWTMYEFPSGYINAEGVPESGGYTGQAGGIAGTIDVPNGVGGSVPGSSTIISADLSFDPHCESDITHLLDIVGWWNSAIASTGGLVGATGITIPVDALSGWTASDSFTAEMPDESSKSGSISVSVSRSETDYSFSVTVDAWFPDDGDPGVGHTQISYSGSISLSNANPASDVYADLNNLLGQWNLTDDHVYPWRTSGQVQVAPLVTRNEKGETSPMQGLFCTVDDLTDPLSDSDGNAAFSDGWSATYSQIAWFDPDVYIWQFAPGDSYGSAAATALVQMVDDSVLGGPLAAGYENFFCWQFNDWRGCLDEDSGMFSWWIYGWGMFLNDYNSSIGGDLPQTCTQWTDNYFSIGTTPGAYLAYNDYIYIPLDEHGYEGRASTPGLVGYKYAEILNRWPSQNFGRPSGPDKFLYDETLVYCVTDLSGSGAGATFSLTNWEDSGVSLADTSGLWGGASVGGWYEISASGSTVTLGTKIYDLPSDWTSRSGDDDVCFGKLRFDGCAALRGRQAITVSGTTATFAIAQTQFGLTTATHTEQIDLYDASYTLLASNVAATRVNDSSFTTAAAYPTAVWVTSTGVKYYFDDQFPKGDFVVLQWLLDNRTNAEGARLTGQLDCNCDQVDLPDGNYGYAAFSQDAHCLPTQPCTPAVVCFTPNGESWSNGITYAFPSTFDFDGRYGSRWQGYVQPNMTDLFWQEPHIPCGLDAAWTMDNGSCQEDTDTIHYYALAPMVEARLTLPANYGAGADETPPALPSGIVIGWLSPVDNTGADVAYPPGFVGFNVDGTPASRLTPWVIHSLLCAAIAPDSTCRFEGDYENQVIDCA